MSIVCMLIHTAMKSVWDLGVKFLMSLDRFILWPMTVIAEENLFI